MKIRTFIQNFNVKNEINNNNTQNLLIYAGLRFRAFNANRVHKIHVV